MTHFRGQIRGPHWGPAMDNMLIEFWRKHECLFNSSLDSYHDKERKTKLWTEFSRAIGKPVCDVERRSRSLRTQYGRVLWHPDRVSTAQQRMIRDKLHFLRPYIVRRRGDHFLEETYGDREEEEEEEEEEEKEEECSLDQETGSSFDSQLDADLSGPPEDEPSALKVAPLHRPKPQGLEVVTPSRPYSHGVEVEVEQPNHTVTPDANKLTAQSEADVLQQFASVMLSDMRQIRDRMLLMRLRRDITDLVFNAVEEDLQRRCVQGPSHATHSWRQRLLRRRRSKTSEVGWRKRRREEARHTRRSPLAPQTVQQGAATEETNQNHALLQPAEMKRETEVKMEEETLQSA